MNELMRDALELLVYDRYSCGTGRYSLAIHGVINIKSDDPQWLLLEETIELFADTEEALVAATCDILDSLRRKQGSRPEFFTLRRATMQ